MPKRILIADDDAGLRATIRTLLPRDFDVLEAASGRQAVEIAGRARPALILLDITMPEMSGIDALRAIKVVDPAVAVIMLTSELHIETAKKTLECGAAAYVTKPFDMEYLNCEIRRLTCPKPADNNSGRPWRMGA